MSTTPLERTGTCSDCVGWPGQMASCPGTREPGPESTENLTPDCTSSCAGWVRDGETAQPRATQCPCGGEGGREEQGLEQCPCQGRENRGWNLSSLPPPLQTPPPSKTLASLRRGTHTKLSWNLHESSLVSSALKDPSPHPHTLVIGMRLG